MACVVVLEGTAQLEGKCTAGCELELFNKRPPKVQSTTAVMHVTLIVNGTRQVAEPDLSLSQSIALHCIALRCSITPPS